MQNQNWQRVTPVPGRLRPVSAPGGHRRRRRGRRYALARRRHRDRWHEREQLAERALPFRAGSSPLSIRACCRAWS